MTNVRRPIHLQLRPGATLGPNGATPPFSLNSPTAVTSPAGVLLPSDLSTGRRVSPATSHPAPIRPNALMNFSSSILSATPTTRVRESPMGRQASRRRLQQSAAGGLTSAATQFISTSAQHQHHQHHHQQQQQQQSPKALSPSGSLNDALPSQILPHLYVGNQEQTNRETVNKLNIKYILSLGLLPQLLQNANYTASSMSPGSPSKSTPLGSPTSATNNITTSPPMENTTTNTNSTSSITNGANTHHQQQNHNHQYLTHPQQQQQQILMPSRDSSRDFKIRLRSSTPNCNTAVSLGASQLISGCGAGGGGSSGTPAGLTHQQQQQPASSPADHYHRQAFVVGAAVGNQDRPMSARMTSTTAPSVTSGVLDELKQEAEVDDENKGVKQVRSIHCKCINISDNSDQSLLKFFDEAFAFIDEARRKKCNILVHCLAGISRSPTIAIGYLMRVKSLHWREAYDLVKQCRPQIDPNLNFMGQLRIYQKSLKNDEHDLDERVNY